ncbi:cadherin-related family member 5 isoform X3 [Pimephales promelas]|uniref:cadherin-related family member 5 isoform X3 n=1 Tax=Pimephales promelas TaxID=90988 RepID=UPI001955DC1E|nr:cadherin-related family member 5 isoform X3 [Pimephales promelas]KAG1941430.1 cadherin-related family [Pimephales promelas]
MQLKRKSTTTIFGCVFALFIPKICFADKICTAPSEPVTIKENNTDDTLVVHINVTTKDVTLNLTENPGNAFYLRGSELIAKKGLDFETLSGPEELTVQVRCNKTGYRSITLIVIVRVENINDNYPSFGQSEYTLNVNELTPVNTSIGLIEAVDDDSEVLYYSIEPTLNRYFRLENMYTPKILVNKVLDYDVIQQVKLLLYAQDTPLPLQHTPLPSQPSERSFTATATITVNIKDIDNRPPWFQPCTRVTSGNAKICLSLGYRGRVNLTEKQDGALQLQPGPVYARDGDKSRNEEISYKIVRGNEDNIFQIDENSGNISMLKPADIAGPISLLVLASQVLNRDQFATTSVTIDVMKKSRNPPRFEKERYEGYVYISSGPENMVLRDRTTNRPFRVRARDEDFASGINPDIRYEVQYSSYVNITTDGFILLKKAVRTDSFALQLRAVDVSTGESGTAALAVLVIPSAGVQSPDESFRAGDMALLGFVMAALLVLCLIVIGYLISRVKKGNPDAFKSEVSIFSSKLRDTGRSRARRAELREGRLDAVQAARVRVIPRERLRHCRSCGLQTSFNHSHHSPVVQTKGKANKQRVKSILAKERRKDDGHKSVWFKESEDSSDIEVEIIPDTIGIKPEDEVEKGEGDFASHPLEDSQMELGDLIMSNIQDLSSREISDGRDGLNTDRKDP